MFPLCSDHDRAKSRLGVPAALPVNLPPLQFRSARLETAHVVTLLPFAQTNARRPFRPVAIKHDDRFSHMYVIGKTGVGKTTLLETLLRHDIQLGNGCALIDPTATS
jgi:hypothetical protein